MEKFYPTDMTDEQWELVQTLLPPDKKTGRPRTTDSYLFSVRIKG
jgi:transposase